MKKVCIIYANCQNKLIAEYLNRSSHFNREYLIHRFPVHRLIEQKSTIPEELLKQADLFIYQPVKDIHGDRSSQSILSKLSPDCQKISFPSLYFKGYFPQYCKNPANQIIKPNYPYGIIPPGDTNIIALLAKGKSVAQITEILSDPNFYSQEFLLNNLDGTLQELARRESQLSIKVSSFIKENYQNYYLFHTQNHPTDIFGIYVVNQILKLLDLPRLTDNLFINNPTRGVLDSFQIPIYPSVIKHLNLNFVDYSSVYRHSSFSTNEMTFSRYISEYIELYIPPPKNAKKFFFESITLTKQNKLQQAIDKLKKAIQIKPNNATYYGNLGDIYLKQNKLDDAELAYRKCIELSPTWEDFYQSLGKVLLKKDKLAEAILVYEKALLTNPVSAKIHRFLGDTLLKQNKLDRAENIYQKAIDLDPSNAFNYRCLGDVFKKKNFLDLAVFNYQKAISFSPNTSYFYSNLSIVLAKQNKLDEAISICQQAIELSHQDPNYYRNLGDIQLQKGNIDDALLTYQKAIKLNPQQIEKIFLKLSTILKARNKKIKLT
ncbi:MAG: WcbI family polysaccharide biosynthesis putative acetyltransferase [Pleurocapsa sp. MO_226.B13]|nr:WcbI family polysaccharide biosynthesis putative acetyltransferase [Pleurocapsa sp. MO_226.B13]